METLLTELVKHIGANAPELALVDEDYGQLEMIDQQGRDTYPVIFPCVLVDVPDTSWSNVASPCQRGTAQVRVKLAIDCYDDTHYNSGTIDKVKEREALRKSIYLLCQGWIHEDQQLVRTSSKRYTMNHGIKVYEEYYDIAVSEYISKDTLPVKAGIKITPVVYADE